MPKHSKKSIKQKLDFKQKKLLKTRLIRISMVIDDYVYKNKPISTNEAKVFAEEVSNYKQQCENDVRTLQVIEKITRCMNAIINEHQEQNGDINNFQNASEYYCPSPVYSLPEEDKIYSQATTYLHLNTENKHNNSNDFDTMDLCNDNDKEIAEKRNMQVEVEIHRAMTTLSIRESDNNQDLNMIDCSQSILMDFNANREAEIRQISKDKTQAKISKPKTFVPPYVQTSVSKNDCSQSILKEFNPTMTDPTEDNGSSTIRPQFDIKDKVSAKLNTTTSMTNKDIPGNKNIVIKNVRFINNIDLTDDETNNKNKCQHKDNIVENNNNTKKVIVTKNVVFSNNINLTDDNDTTDNNKRKQNCKTKKAFNKSKSKISTKQNKGGKKKKTNVQTTIVSKASTKIPTTNNNKRIEDTSVSVNKTNNVHGTLPIHNANISLNETVHQKTQSTYICELNNVNNSICSKSIAKIYNANIENDLSWMENIRYVREISTDEFDPKFASLTNKFWENFDLPSEWNEKDFDF